MEKIKRKVVLLCLLFPCFVIGSNLNVRRINYFVPSEVLTTPHIKWLNPYYKGKLKILFIVPRTGMREIVEISRRMEIEYNVFVTHGINEIARKERVFDWVKGASEEERLEYLDEILDHDYDVIVMGGINWNMFSSEYKYRILKKVSEGTGLVWVIGNEIDEILNKLIQNKLYEIKEEEIKKYFSNFPFRFISSKYLSLQPFLKNTIEFLKLGEGRICLLKYTSGAKLWMGPFHPLVPGPLSNPLETNLVDYEYQLQFFIDCILYSSGKKNSFLYNLKETVSFNREWLPAKIEYIFENKERAEQLEASFFIMDKTGKKIYRKDTNISLMSEENHLIFDIPCLPAGGYTASLILSKKGKIIDFSSCFVEIKNKSFIKEIVLSKRGYKKDEVVEGKLIIEKPNKETKILLTLMDTYGRIIDKKEIDVNNEELNFSFNIDRPLTIVQIIKTQMIDEKGEVISEESKKFFIKDFYPPEDEFRVILWSEMPGNGTFFTPYILDYWKENGIDTIYLGFNGFIYLSNMWNIHYLYRFADEKTDWYGKPYRDSKDLIRKPCLTDPEYLKKLKDTLSSKCEQLKEYPVKEISFGDECIFVSGDYDICFSKTCIEDFKKFLKDKYKTVEEMNKEYGTDYKSFEEVSPLSIDEARKQKQILMWIDHRLHMDNVWSGIFKYSGDICREVIDRVKTGYEGSDASVKTWYAADYWKLSKTMELNNIYFREFQACVWRSFFEKNKLLGLGWMGGYGSPYDKKSNYATLSGPWRYLFKGANSLWIWHANPREGSVTSPDFAFYDFFSDTINAIKEIKSGIGKMLITSDKMTDVGIYYSPSSVHANTFLALPVSPEKNLNSITMLLIDLGFQPRVYSYEEVKKGVLLKHRPKFLFLHNLQYLSPEEINEIKRYVKEGGVVIADVLPGIRDGDGNLRREKENMLDVFGVECSGPIQIQRKEKLTIEGNVKLPFILYDASIKLKNANALYTMDDTPLLIKNKYGKGYGILLNFSLEGYKRERNFFQNPYFLIFKNLLKGLDIKPEIVIEGEIPYLEINSFRAGEAEIFTFYQDIPEDEKNMDISEIKREPTSFRIRLKERGHIYNVRSGKYYGEKENIEIDITPLEPLIIAVLPYKIESIEISLSAKEIKQGNPLEYSVKVNGKEQPHPQVVNVRFFDPEGKEVKYYSCNIRTNEKKVIKTALNEKKGKWTVVATDIISKKESKTYFSIK